MASSPNLSSASNSAGGHEGTRVVVLSLEAIRYLSRQEGDPHGGLYDLPVIGHPLRLARRLFDDLSPQLGDRVLIKIGKQAAPVGTVVAVAGAAVTVVF